MICASEITQNAFDQSHGSRKSYSFKFGVGKSFWVLQVSRLLSHGLTQEPERVVVLAI